MKRALLSTLLVVFLSAGCEQPNMDMGMPQKPKPYPELAKLEPLIGNWSGTADMVEPSPADMKKMMDKMMEKMPKDQMMPEMSTSFLGGETYEWALGGMYLKGTSWHELPSGEHAHYDQYITWDPRVKKYHAWYFGDMGESGEGWWTPPKESGDPFIVKAKGRGLQGSMRGKGTFRLIGDDTMEWTWSEHRGGQKFKLKGTSKRQKE